METYAVTPYDGGTADLPIDTFFWGALIFLAVVMSGFLAARAIQWLRNPTKMVVQPRPKPRAKPTVFPDEGEHVTEHMTEPPVPQGFGRALVDESSLSYMTDMAGFSEREEEEFLLTYGPPKVRKAVEERRKTREQAQKNQSDS